MTSTPPEAPTGPPPGPPADPTGDHGPRVTRDEVRDLGRLRRSTTNRKIAGVAGGLARHLDIDPVIVRVAFVVLVFFGGAGLILYGACWLLVPEEGRESAPLGLDDRSRSIALILVGVLAALALLGDVWGSSWVPWPLALIAVVVVLFLSRRDSSSSAQPTPPTGAPAPAPGDTYPPAQGPAQGSTYAPAEAPVRPRSPRKRGPVLFWFTLALIALGVGVLGIVDLAGAPVTAAAYPALAVGLTGLMLLVGAFYGRAGGLVLVGLVATAALAVTTAAGEWDGTQLRETPTTAATVEPTYDFSTGELVLDLTAVGNLAALDGRTIQVRGDIGHLEVIVPSGLDTRVEADVDGPGNISLFGEETGGVDLTMDRQHDGGPDAPTLTIDAQLGIGQIEVHQ